MGEVLSKRRAQFFERWALTNAALLLSTGMVAGAFAVTQDGFVPALLDALVRAALPAAFLIVLPVNAAYLFCSAHINTKQQWRGHRAFWIWFMIGATAWTFAIMCTLLFPEG